MNNLDERNNKKKKKPKFIRQDAHKKPGLEFKWRRPKGLHNKVRLGIRGYRKQLATGWGSPLEVKGKSQSGKRIAIICCLKDLETVNKSSDVLVLSRSIGGRKRLEILNAMKEKGFLLHMMDADELIKRTLSRFESRKKKSEEKKANKEAKKKTEGKKTEGKMQEGKKQDKEDKPAADHAVHAEQSADKKKIEKQEKDKVLITKS